MDANGRDGLKWTLCDRDYTETARNISISPPIFFVSFRPDFSPRLLFLPTHGADRFVRRLQGHRVSMWPSWDRVAIM